MKNPKMTPSQNVNLSNMVHMHSHYLRHFKAKSYEIGDQHRLPFLMINKSIVSHSATFPLPKFQSADSIHVSHFQTI